MDTPSTLYTFFQTDFPHNKEGLEEFLNAFQSQSYQKNDIILREGQIDRQLRFLEYGALREYYVGPEKENNINFYTRPSLITDFPSFQNDRASRKNQACLSKVRIKVINKRQYEKLTQKYPCGKEILSQSFQLLLDQKEYGEYAQRTKSPEELYQDILQNRPDWLQNIPQYHIASYLGITPETLSRIRKRISWFESMELS